MKNLNVLSQKRVTGITISVLYMTEKRYKRARSKEIINLREGMPKLPKNSFSFQFVAFNDLVSALELIFSPSAASVILFTAAVRCGSQLYNRIKKEFGTKEEALRRLSELKRKENWGKLTFRDVDFVNGSGKAIVAEAFETMARKAKASREASQPCCNFFRGFLTGFLSELFERSLTIIEEKCVGKGDKHCEFTFR